MQQVST